MSTNNNPRAVGQAAHAALVNIISLGVANVELLSSASDDFDAAIATSQLKTWATQARAELAEARNSHAPLVGALENAVNQFDYIVRGLSLGQSVSISSVQNCAAQARTAIALAKSTTP